MWRELLARYPFLGDRGSDHEQALRALTTQFLARKEFHGAGGLPITDDMALAIAAQACLPIVRLGLHWYDDFVGIVVQPGDVLAHRSVVDDVGVVHHYDEVLAGEAMDRGPVMLNWPDVRGAAGSAEQGYNLVIHEFAHKLDMRDGSADGCPPLPAGFAGSRSAVQARQAWFAVLQPAYEAFREQVIVAERFSGPPAWPDPYGATSIDEFFAVVCEAYFVNRVRLAQEHPAVLSLLDEFFQPRRQQDGPVAISA